MSNENNKMQVDIENLFKQNVNDLTSIKILFRKLKEIEERISQIKYIDSTLANKLKKEYEKLKRIILDENAQAKLSNDIEIINEKLSNDIEPIIENLSNDIETINSQMDTKANKDDIETINSQMDTKANKNDIETIKSQMDNIMHVDLRQFPKKIGESDDTERIQRAINYINNRVNSDFYDSGYGVLIIPPGVYNVRTLILKSNVHIQGSGMGVTRINPVSNSGYVFDTIGTTAKIKMSQCEIKDLSISPTCRAGGDVKNSNVGGINFEFSERCTVENVRITNINGIGIRNLENYDSFFQNIELMYVGNDENPALLLDGTKTDSSNAIHTVGVRIEQCPVLLKLTNGARSNQFVGCKFEGGRVIIEQCNSNVFEGCDFVSISTDKAMIKIGTTVNDIRGLKFNGCSFLASGNHQAIGIEGDATAISITLTNCNFTGMKKSISGNGFFNIIGCEFMDCLSPVITLERGRINSCVLSYIAGNDSIIRLNGNVICKDCYMTSNGSTSNGIYITSESIVCDNMISYIDTGILCVGSNNIIKGNVITNSKTEYSIGDKSLNKVYDRFGEPIE